MQETRNVVKNFRFLNFRDWKIKNKIVSGFFLISFVYCVASIFITHNIVNEIQKNGSKMHIVHQLMINQKDLELSLRNYYLVHDIDELENINLIKRKAEFEEKILVYNDFESDLEDKNIIDGIKTEADEFFVLADEFIFIHNKRLKLELQFEDKYQIEKNLRYSMSEPVLSTEDSDIVASYYAVTYMSKESLFQYKDKKHFSQWKDSIENLELKIGDDNIIEKGILHEYKLVANELEQLSLDIERIDVEEIEKLSEIRNSENLISKLQNQSNQINTANSQIFNENILFSSIFVIFITFVILIFVGYVVAYYISNPINKIFRFAEGFSGGNLKERIEINSDDEIGKTAVILNETLDKIEESREVLEIKVIARTKRLKDLANELDDKVKDRTKKLKENVQKLERFNNIAVDREIKMIELKEQIKKLKQGVCTIDKYDLSQEGKENPQNCWEYWDCEKDVRDKCKAYISDSGKECWLISSGKCPRSREKGMEYCVNCGWYKQVNNK